MVNTGAIFNWQDQRYFLNNFMQMQSTILQKHSQDNDRIILKGVNADLLRLA